MDTRLAGEALAALVAEIDEPITAYGWNPDSVVVPCVFPREWEKDFTADIVMLGGGAALVDFTLSLLVARADDKSGQAQLQEYADQVVDAIHSDATLSGQVSDLQVTSLRAAGFQEYAGTDYLALEAIVRCYG